MAIFPKIFGGKHAPVAPPYLSQLPAVLERGAGAPERQRAPREARIDEQLSTLMVGLKEDAVALKCQQERILSDWQLSLDQLTGKMATLQPLLAKTVQAGSDREQALSRSLSAETELKHRLAQAERDLAHYQPSAIQFESELRTLRHQLSTVQSSAIASENECRKALGMVNDLQQRLGTSDVARQKLAEDNNSYRQRLQKHEITLPILVREAAQLKSELAVAQSDREHLDSELAAIGRKFSAECEEHHRDKELLAQVQAKFALLHGESQSKIAEAEERARHSAEKLAGLEQQIHDMEIRQSALLSKIDFMTRINQRQRDDLRRQTDHIGNLEASNRQLLEGAPPVPFPGRNGDVSLMDLDREPQVFRAAGE
jgi:chromosome segregation ATPase